MSLDKEVIVRMLRPLVSMLYSIAVYTIRDTGYHFVAIIVEIGIT